MKDFSLTPSSGQLQEPTAWAAGLQSQTVAKNIPAGTRALRSQCWNKESCEAKAAEQGKNRPRKDRVSAELRVM